MPPKKLASPAKARANAERAEQRKREREVSYGNTIDFSIFLTLKKAQVLRDTAERRDWEAKSRGINTIVLYCPLKFKLLDNDGNAITRPLTAENADRAWVRRPDDENPSVPYEPTGDDDDEYIELRGITYGNAFELFVQQTNDHGQLLFCEGAPIFRDFTDKELAEDGELGRLPAFSPTEKVVFIKNFRDIWGVDPGEFTGTLISPVLLPCNMMRSAMSQFPIRIIQGSISASRWMSKHESNICISSLTPFLKISSGETLRKQCWRLIALGPKIS